MPSVTREKVEEQLRKLRPEQLAAVSQFITSLTHPESGKSAARSQALDNLYGALADSPMPEITSDPLPEQRDEM